MPRVPRKKHTDDRSPLESKLDGELRLLHQRGLTKPDLHDLEALLKVALAQSATGTDLERVETALAHAISAYRDNTKIEAAHLWYGLHPKTRDTRALSSTARTIAAWEYVAAQARKDGEKPYSREYYRSTLGGERWAFLARQLALRYNESETSLPVIPDTQAADNLRPVRQLKVGLKTQFHTVPAADIFSEPDDPHPPKVRDEKMIVIKTRASTYGFTKRFMHVRFHLVESFDVFTIDLLLVLGVLLGVIALIVLAVYLA